MGTKRKRVRPAERRLPIIVEDFALDKSSLQEARCLPRQKSKQSMKVITHKRLELAKEYLAGLLKKDGASQTLTVQQWLDAAQYRPAQFPSSLPALEILHLLGFGDEIVQAEA